MKIEKEVEKLIFDIFRVINWFDVEMTKPSTQQRGKRVAKVLNDLELRVDLFARHELNFGFKKIENMKKRAKNA